MDASGFSLLELLVVVGILVAVSVIAMGAFTHVGEHANDRLARSEMQQIAKAIRQFKQDTGYYPKSGPFDLANYTGSIPYGNLPTHAGSSNADRDRWFYSPANLYQLTTADSPLGGTSHLLETWDTETGRGWRGPYLEGFGEGYLDIRDDINGDGTTYTRIGGDFTGDPLTGTNIEDVEGIADPYEHRAEEVGGDTLLDWSANAGSTDEREIWGRPYLVFDLDASPWIVSFGPDGNYDTTQRAIAGGDDIVLEIE